MENERKKAGTRGAGPGVSGTGIAGFSTAASDAGLWQTPVLPGMGFAILQQRKSLVALRTHNSTAAVFTDRGHNLELFAAPFTAVFINRHGDYLLFRPVCRDTSHSNERLIYMYHIPGRMQ
nr:hypothetical protein [Geobacter sp. SVR]